MQTLRQVKESLCVSWTSHLIQVKDVSLGQEGAQKCSLVTPSSFAVRSVMRDVHESSSTDNVHQTSNSDEIHRHEKIGLDTQEKKDSRVGRHPGSTEGEPQREKCQGLTASLLQQLVKPCTLH